MCPAPFYRLPGDPLFCVIFSLETSNLQRRRIEKYDLNIPTPAGFQCGRPEFDFWLIFIHARNMRRTDQER